MTILGVNFLGRITNISGASATQKVAQQATNKLTKNIKNVEDSFEYVSGRATKESFLSKILNKIKSIFSGTGAKASKDQKTREIDTPLKSSVKSSIDDELKAKIAKRAKKRAQTGKSRQAHYNSDYGIIHAPSASEIAAAKRAH